MRTPRSRPRPRLVVTFQEPQRTAPLRLPIEEQGRGCGEVEALTPRCAAPRPASTPAAVADAIAKLQDLFPSWEHQALVDVLAAAGGNPDRAASILLRWSGQGTPAPRATAAAVLRDSLSGESATATEGVRARLSPVSPWQDAGLLELKPQPDAAGPKRVLARPQYDRAIAARFQHKFGGRQLAQIMKVASLWKAHAQAHGSESPPFWVSPSAREREINHQLSRLSSEARVREGKELLRQRCAFFGLKQVEMKDDGNCQFRAVSQELFGTQEHHALVRAEAVAHMVRRGAEFRGLFADGEWEAYVAKMALSGEWGDELTLRATADAFEVKIHVVTSTEQNWYLAYEPDSPGHACGREVFMTYIAPIHYNTLEPTS